MSSCLFLFFKGLQRVGNFEIGILVESPQFHWVGIGVEATIPLLELELGHSKNQFQRIGIGIWNSELTPILFQTLLTTIIPLWQKKNSSFYHSVLAAVFGKELGSTHNSIFQFRFFGICFWNTPIPTPVVELELQLQFWFNGIGGIPLGFQFQISLPLFCSKRPLVTSSSPLFSTFSPFHMASESWKIWNRNPSGIPPIPLSQNWSCSSNSKCGIGMGGQFYSKICQWNWNWWNCSKHCSKVPNGGGTK